MYIERCLKRHLVLRCLDGPGDVVVARPYPCGRDALAEDLNIGVFGVRTTSFRAPLQSDSSVP